MKTVCAVLAILIFAQAPEKKTVWSGVYSADQAARGEEPYKKWCGRCHGPSLEGTEGNGLVGKDFMERWREGSLGTMFEFVTDSMPRVRQGEGRPLIGVPTYLEIVAFILSKNQFPAGPNPLTADGLDDIRIEHSDGPRPLPTGALVVVSGCLAGSGQNWSMASATEAVRTKSTATTDYAEFKAAEAAAPGKESYKLFNLGFLGAKFKPESNVGAKLLVKGNLIRQPESTRISVLAIRKVADTCP